MWHIKIIQAETFARYRCILDYALFMFKYSLKLQISCCKNNQFYINTLALYSSSRLIFTNELKCIHKIIASMYTLQFTHHQLTSSGNCKLHLLAISTPFECDSYFPFYNYIHCVCWIAHNLFIQLKRHKEREENMEWK